MLIVTPFTLNPQGKTIHCQEQCKKAAPKKFL